MSTQYIDSPLLMKLLRGGIDNLNKHVDEINELNVFPIPDGDTGYNMLLTMEGGLRAVPDNNEESEPFPAEYLTVCCSRRGATPA